MGNIEPFPYCDPVIVQLKGRGMWGGGFVRKRGVWQLTLLILLWWYLLVRWFLFGNDKKITADSSTMSSTGRRIRFSVSLIAGELSGSNFDANHLHHFQ